MRCERTEWKLWAFLGLEFAFFFSFWIISFFTPTLYLVFFLIFSIECSNRAALLLPQKSHRIVDNYTSDRGVSLHIYIHVHVHTYYCLLVHLLSCFVLSHFINRLNSLFAEFFFFFLFFSCVLQKFSFLLNWSFFLLLYSLLSHLIPPLFVLPLSLPTFTIPLLSFNQFFFIFALRPNIIAIIFLCFSFLQALYFFF